MYIIKQTDAIYTYCCAGKREFLLQILVHHWQWSYGSKNHWWSNCPTNEHCKQLKITCKKN